MRDYADKIVRDYLMKPQVLRDVVHAQVPSLADGFDFERRKFIPPQVLLPDGRERETDLAFEVPFRFGADERIALVLVLIEHQTRPNRFVVLRMLLYIVMYWEKQWRAWGEAPAPKSDFRLTPVLPIVFHTGTQPWHGARSIKELLGEPHAFHEFTPDWTPLFWELSSHSADDLLSREEAFLYALAVVRVEDAERAEFERVFAEALKRILAGGETDRIRWTDLVRFIFGWIAHRRPSSELTDLVQLAQNLAGDPRQREEVASMFESYADVLLAEGERKGQITGERSGRAKEARTIITRQATKKWGEPEATVIAALNVIEDVDRLERMSDRLLDVGSWTELLATL